MGAEYRHCEPPLGFRMAEVFMLQLGVASCSCGRVQVGNADGERQMIVLEAQ